MATSGFLKAVGAVAAVVSLLLGLNQLTGVVQNLRVHHKEFSDALASGDQEQRRGDYRAALRSFKHAAELDPIDREARARELGAALLWIETAHAQSESFTEVANQVLPVFDAAVTTAKGPAAGDILSHIAWANFLKYRDGVREGVNIDENLKAALDADPSNAFAHAMSGFWILWQGGEMTSAKSQFAASLATGRARPFIRQLQLSALTSGDSSERDAEALRAANDARTSGDAIDAALRRRVFWNCFSSRFHSREKLVASLSVLSSQDTEATYDWLDDRPPDAVKTSSRAFVEANLTELQGRQADALALYRALQKQLRNTDNALGPAVDAAVGRLSHAR